MLALSGVQRFISESRSTSDLSSASEIVARLAAEAAWACRKEGAVVVFPALNGEGGSAGGSATKGVGMPNRVVALTPAGQGERIAGRAAAAVEARWTGWVRRAFDREVATPGMPSVQWVCAPAALGGYQERWRAAQAGLVARRRVRDFPPVEYLEQRLCSLSPRWPAEDDLPRDLRAHERDALSAANWVKRLWRERLSDSGKRPGFPSTSAIASATFRQQVLEHLDDPTVRGAVDELRRCVVDSLDPVRETPMPGLHASGEPGEWLAAAAGRWVYEDTWQEAVLQREYGELATSQVVSSGRAAARRLLNTMWSQYKVPAPTDHLALLAQDLDSMGRFLGGEAVAGRRLAVTQDAHTQVSRRLGALAEAQCARLASAELLGVPVYAGGDDLLAFAAAKTALSAAAACHAAVPPELPTASTAVLFFHHRSSLRQALRQVRRLLDEAKDAAADKHALAVGFLRRSGVREHSIQPWVPAAMGGQATAAELFGVFAESPQRRLSPRLVADLERDADELADPDLPESFYRAELARLVERHGGSRTDAEALLRLGLQERAWEPAAGERQPGSRRPVAAARVAVFIRQECR